jgi:hypothetical protein
MRKKLQFNTKYFAANLLIAFCRVITRIHFLLRGSFLRLNSIAHPQNFCELL